METFKTKGTCATQIFFDVENNVLTQLSFKGGCTGNHQGISRLAVGQNIDTIIEKLEGTICRGNTSCPDQLAKALKQYKETHQN